MEYGKIIILNGAPRSGKSSIATQIQNTFEGPWLNIGVDAYVKHLLPKSLLPGIGLRPGGERKDLESFIVTCYAALYETIAAHSRLGLNVVVDVGHHDSYARPLFILRDCAKRLAGLPVLFVGVKCSLAVIMARRNHSQEDERTSYVKGASADPVPFPVQLWQEKVHEPGIYDLEVDTTDASPEAAAAIIGAHLHLCKPTANAFDKLRSS
ncbi:chloramphenicol phosphotransferase CPT family protein [Puia sp.]|uniref:chloramphenicol phosphotransferase CPT family protein n=1 Tax=Puia sp. TaxID=2045100 RepID=UPI002F3EBDFC